MTSDPKRLVDACGWAKDDSLNPSIASADWLAADIDPDRPNIEALFTDPETSLRSLKAAKNVYKTMRLVGESARDRRTGAHCYLASIASAMIFHNTRISTQSDAALMRGFDQLSCQLEMPAAIRTLASRAYQSLLDYTGGAQKSSLSSFMSDDELRARMDSTDTKAGLG